MITLVQIPPIHRPLTPNASYGKSSRKLSFKIYCPVGVKTFAFAVIPTAVIAVFVSVVMLGRIFGFLHRSH